MSGGGRALRILGFATVVAGGYYLYQASGQPKQAVKIAEHDAEVGIAKVKGEFKSDSAAAKEKGREYGEKAGAQYEKAIADAKTRFEETRKSANETYDQGKAKAEEARRTLEEKRREAGKEINATINQADRKVEDAAGKAKSSISSWFGGK